MSFLTFLRAIFAQIGLCLKRWTLLWCSYVLFATNISINIILLVLMTVWRWSHAGKVCSGDFLEDRETADRDVYLIYEGRFIKIMLIIIYSALGLSCLSIIIVSVCMHARQAKIDDLADSQIDKTNGDLNTSSRSVLRVRQSAFT